MATALEIAPAISRVVVRIPFLSTALSDIRPRLLSALPDEICNRGTQLSQRGAKLSNTLQVYFPYRRGYCRDGSHRHSYIAASCGVDIGRASCWGRVCQYV